MIHRKDMAGSFIYILNTLPYIIKSPLYLVQHFYSNTASVQSRILAVTLKHSLDIFVFYKSPLTKDANPTVGNVIREIGGFGTTALNVYNEAKYAIKDPEIQDVTHLLGQGGRLLCKASFQLLNNISDPVILARTSNVACDSIGIIATDISRTSQKNHVKLYYLWNNEEAAQMSAHILTVLKDTLTNAYLVQSVGKTVFKALILDQVGEVIKLATSTAVVQNSAAYVKDSIEQFMGLVFSESVELFRNDQNIYAHSNVILEANADSIKGQAMVIANILIKLAPRVLLDLYVTGPILLSSAKDAVDYVGNNQIWWLQKTAVISTAILLAYNKEAVFSSIGSSIATTIEKINYLLGYEDEGYEGEIDDQLPYGGEVIFNANHTEL